MTKPFAKTLRRRGWQPVHTSGCRCPGCGMSNWIIGRTLAECARCGAALPLSPPSTPAVETAARIFPFRRELPAPEAPAAIPLAAGACDPEAR